VDFHSRDVIAHSAQGVFHYASDASGQRLVTLDCMVCIDLDLDADLLPNCLIHGVSYTHTLPNVSFTKFMELGYQPASAFGG
jgi:hypothetical protein